MSIKPSRDRAGGGAERFGLAIFLILLAIFLFDVQGALIKHMGDRYPVQQLAVFRNIFGLLPNLLILFLSRDWHRLGRPVWISQWKLALGRGLFVTMAQFCLYTSLTKLEFATASTLAFAGPLFVTTLSIPILGHRVGPWQWLAVAVGFVGIILVMQPGSDVFTPYALLPIGAALGYALTSVSVRLIDQSVPSVTINLYSTAGAILGSTALMFTTSGFMPVANFQDWMTLVAMGTFGGLAVLVMIMSYRLTRPSNVAPFEYFGIPFAFILGWYFFDEAPFGKLFPGVLFIVAGGLLIVWRERRKSSDQGD
jgi:drug/metabolite transporter (DMT)-like permease